MMVVQGSWVVGKDSLSAVSRIFLWCWSVEVDSRHTLVFLLYQGSARFSLLLECLTLELCTHVSKKRGDSKRGRQLESQTLSRRHTRGRVTQPCLPAWWRLFIAKVAVTAGNLSIAFVFMCVIQSPTLFMLHLK